MAFLTALSARTRATGDAVAKQLVRAAHGLALLTSLMLAACNEKPPPPWLSDTGVPFVDYGLVWMDDERLLFQRMEQVAKVDLADPWGAFAFPLNIWSRNGDLRTLTRADISRSCFARRTGTLSYELPSDDGKASILKIGAPDAMVDRTLAAASDRVFNPFTCSFQPRPRDLAGRTLVPLRPGHGIVDLGRPRSGDAARLLTADGRSVELPFDQTSIDPKNISADGESYLVFAKTLRNASCRRVWRLTPGRGAAQEACLPEMASSRVVRTALGWALDKREYGHDGSIGDSGIFLISANGGPVKLVAGFTENLAVSPDGCRLAFGHAPDLSTSCTDGTYTLKTVKVVDLCAFRAEILGR